MSGVGEKAISWERFFQVTIGLGYYGEFAPNGVAIVWFRSYPLLIDRVNERGNVRDKRLAFHKPCGMSRWRGIRP